MSHCASQPWTPASTASAIMLHLLRHILIPAPPALPTAPITHLAQRDGRLCEQARSGMHSMGQALAAAPGTHLKSQALTHQLHAHVPCMVAAFVAWP